jgi:hypothetical protein
LLRGNAGQKYPADITTPSSRRRSVEFLISPRRRSRRSSAANLVGNCRWIIKASKTGREMEPGWKLELLHVNRSVVSLIRARGRCRSYSKSWKLLDHHYTIASPTLWRQRQKKTKN